MKNVYFKSFRRDATGTPLATFVFDSAEKVCRPFQTFDEALSTRTIKINTKHPSLKDRLSVSVPTEDFPGVYRPEGVLFTTKQSPAYCTPVDLMALTHGRTLTSEDYGSDFLPGYEKFVFPDVKSMTAAFPNSRVALEAVNKFRESHGLNPINKNMNYNEICFEEDVKFKPVALVVKFTPGRTSPEAEKWGGLEMARQLAEKGDWSGFDRGLPVYDSIDAHLRDVNYPLKHPIKNFKKLFQFAISSGFDGYGGLTWEGGLR